MSLVTLRYTNMLWIFLAWLPFPGIATADASEPLMLELVQVAAADPNSVPLISKDGKPAQFHLMASYSCPRQSIRKRLFLSIADASLDAKLSVSPQELMLTVPAPQLAGILQTMSCPAGVERAKRQVQAYATLSCLQESTARHYSVAQPLTVSVVCTEANKQTPVTEDQAGW